MVIAALVTFAVLLLAWAMAPDAGLSRPKTAAGPEELPIQIAA